MELNLQTKVLQRLFRVSLILLGGIAMMAVLYACNGSKALAKKGGKLQEAGLYSDAALFYYNSLLKNSNNVDARIGLSATGQKVLNDKLADFSKARTMGDTRAAVYAYKNAVAYRQKIEKLGINLEAPSYFKDDFEAAKKEYVKTLYDKGNNLLSQENFDEANRVFEELVQLEPNYKDVNELQSVSVNEPLYLNGTALFDAQSWRKAYYNFDQIYQSDPGYKDVRILRKECLTKGQYPVAVTDFKNETRYRNIDKQVRAYVLTALADIDDPFLKIIERENMDVILKEQRINLSGVVNEQSAAEVGNLLGARAILSGSVLSYSPLAGKMRIEEKEAYEAYRVKRYNKVEDKTYYQTRYKPVTYKEYYNSNQVKISFEYKLVSLETGEILFSRVINKSMDDQVYYGTYEGEITALYPKDKDGVVTSSREHKQLVALMRAPRNLEKIDKLANDAYKAIAGEISSALVNEIRNE